MFISYTFRNRPRTAQYIGSSQVDVASFDFAETGTQTPGPKPSAPLGWFDEQLVIGGWVDDQFTKNAPNRVWFDPYWTVAGATINKLLNFSSAETLSFRAFKPVNKIISSVLSNTLRLSVTKNLLKSLLFSTAETLSISPNKTLNQILNIGGTITPTLVQHVASTQNDNNGITGNAFVFSMPNNTLKGNCIVLTITYPYSATRTVSISDSAGDTWPSAAITSGLSTTSNLNTQIYVLPNASAGLHILTVTFDAAIKPFQYTMTEFANIASVSPADGTSSARGASTSTVSAGSYTPSTNNDANGGHLIFTHAISDDTVGTLAANKASAMTATNSAKLLYGNNTSTIPSIASYYVQAVNAAYNPGFNITQSTSTTFLCTSVALKAAKAGTLPGNGIRIIRLLHCTPEFSGTTDTFVFPCDGNALVFTTANGTDLSNITGITDSNSQTYTSRQTVAGTCQVYDKLGANPSNSLTLTVTFSATPIQYSAHLWDITGVDLNQTPNVSCLYTSAPNANPFNDFPDHTPGFNAPGLTIAQTGMGTSAGFSFATGSPAGAVIDNCEYTGITDQDQMDNADPVGHLYFTTNTPQTWNWNFQGTLWHGSTAFYTAISYKSNPTSGGFQGLLLTLVTAFISGGGTTNNKALTFTNAQLLTLARSVGKIVATPVTQALSLIKNINHFINIASQNTLTLIKNSGRLLTLASAETLSLIKSVGKTLKTSSSESVLFNAIKQTGGPIGKLLTMTSTEVVTISRNIAKTINFSSAETLQAIKNIARSILLSSANILTLIKNPSKVFTMANPNTLTLTKGINWIRAFASASKVTVTRLMGTTLLFSSPEVVKLIKNSSKILTFTQVQALSVIRSIGKLLKTSSGNVVTTNIGKAILRTFTANLGEALALIKSTNKNISLISNQTLSVVKTIAKTILNSSANVLSLVKNIGKNLKTSSANLLTSTQGKAILRTFTANISEKVTVSAIKFFNRTFTLSSPQTLKLTRLIGTTINFVSNQTVSLVRKVGITLLVPITNTVSLIKSVGKTIKTSSASLLTTFRSRTINILKTMGLGNIATLNIGGLIKSVVVNTSTGISSLFSFISTIIPHGVPRAKFVSFLKSPTATLRSMKTGPTARVIPNNDISAKKE